jgi:hypothetical protein
MVQMSQEQEQAMGEQVFDLGNLPSDPRSWPLYRKTALTHAIRISGSFTVQTSEGPLHCADGFLAIDARGYPYPIAAGEMELIYVPAGD